MSRQSQTEAFAWRSAAGGWLLIALGAVVASAAYAGGLVLARMPVVRALLPLEQPFPTLLVLHVELAAGVWFLAMPAVLWSLAAPQPGRPGWRAAGRAGAALSGAGTLAMAGAPLLGAGRALLSDYLPVLDHPVFLGGGVAFLAGWGLAVGLALRGFARRGGAPASAPVAWIAEGLGPQGTRALAWAALVGAAALAVGVQGWLRLPPGDWRGGYRALVWGPGHLLQTLHMLLALAAWGWLGRLAGRPAAPAALRWLPPLIAVPALAAAAGLPWLQATAPALAHRTWTGLMAWEGSLTLLALAAALRRPRGASARGVPPAAGQAVYGAVLDGSLLLWGCGVALGFLIRQDNALVPAHYHGAIGGLTLAYMGLAYRLLEGLGAAAPPRRWAVWQARLYAAGLLALMAGLVLAGIPRKAAALHAGSAGAPGWSAWAGLGLQGTGGAAALAGTFAFLAVVAMVLGRARGRGRPALAAGEGTVS